MLGFTKTRASCQPDHALDSHTQSRRSAGFESWATPTALEDRELMPQGEDLQLQGGA